MHSSIATLKAHSKTRKAHRPVFFYLLPIRKKVALGNLDICFPAKDNHWKKKVIKEAYVNLGIDIFEFLYFPEFNKEKLKKFIQFNNNQLVTDALTLNKGIFFLCGHYADWELLAFSYCILYEQKLNIIAKIQANRKLNEKINEYRELRGNRIIEVGFSLKEIFKCLAQNEIVCFLIDQSAHPDYSVYINFFGKKVPAFSGPAKIALRLRPELIMATTVRNSDFTYRNYFEKIEYDDLSEVNDENIRILTQRMQNRIEKFITQNPGQWLWFHKRFKHMKN